MRRVTARIAIATATLAALAAVAGAGAGAASAADEPCTSIGSGHYQCTFFPPGNGLTAGAPVQDATGARVGYLNGGTNWIICQSPGATVHNGADYNRWWAYTEANDRHWGWVNAVWAHGGSNDGPFAVAPSCGSRYGSPPTSPPPVTPPPVTPPPVTPPTPPVSAPAPVPCTAIGAGRHRCGFYPAGDGIHGGAPVLNAGGGRVGYLNQGTDWIVCQSSGGTVHHGATYNRWWGYTEANDRHWGWVNAVWARGGDNDGPFSGVANCNGRHGRTPGAPAPPKTKHKPKPRPRNMVALGDSYSSGEGTEPTNGRPCLQSRQAYGWLVASALHEAMTDFAACAGAKTRDVLDDQLGGLSGSTTLVTMSVGGDDADFAGVLARCAGGFGLFNGPCKNFIKKESGIIRDDLPGRLDELYATIRADAPNARVVIVGYPYIFYGACDRSKPLQWLVKPDDLLNDTIAAAAARHGFEFVDPRGPFQGHSACDRDAWINHLYTHDPYKSFHPNADGYRELATLVERAVR